MKKSLLRSSKFIAVALTMGLLFITWSFWYSNRLSNRLQIQKEYELASQEIGVEIEHQLSHLQSLSQQVQVLQASTAEITSGQFKQFVKLQLQQEPLLGIDSVALVKNAAVEHVQSQDKKHTSGPLRDVVDALGDRVPHAPVKLSEPHADGMSMPVGLDLYSDKLMAIALNESAAKDALALTERLSAPKGTKVGSSGLYAMVAPLHLPGTTADKMNHESTTTGWVIVKFDMPAMLGAMSANLPKDLGFDVYDKSAEGAEKLVFRSVLPAEQVGLGLAERAIKLLRIKKVLRLGGKEWTIATYPRATFFEKFSAEKTNWVAILGVITSMLIGYLVYVLGRSRENALKLVRRYTQELKSANSDLLAVLNAIPDLMFEVDLDGRYYQWWSPRHDLLAAPPELFLGKRIAEILPPEASKVCHEVLLECDSRGFSGGSQIQLEIGGANKWFELSAARKLAASGKPHFIVLSRDITERKVAELALLESERQLYLALQGGDLGFWDWNVKSGRLLVNARWYTMLGLDPSLGHADIALWDSLVHPSDRKMLRRLVKAVFHDPECSEFCMEVRVRHAQGHYVWLLDKGTAVARDANGKPLRVIGTHMDVTERKLDEERLRLNEHALKAITQGICITDLQGTVTSVNDALCGITGYSQSEFLGQNSRMLQGAGTDKTTVANIRNAVKTGTVFTGEILNYKKSGQPFWNDLEIAPVLGNDHEVTHFVGITKDISEKKKSDLIIAVERNAIRISAEQLRTLSRRLLDVQETERRRVAHELHDELGQSLTAIKINLLTAQTRKGVPPNPIDLENVRIVEDALQQVRRISLALRPSMLDDLGLKAALAWLAKAASVNRDIAVDFQCNMDQSRMPGEVETACFRIAQEALTNVRRHAHASKVAVRLEVLSHQLKMEIEDNGVGYSAPSGEDEQIEPSLGLLGMKERASSIGGTINVDSMPDQGTTVTLHCRLPELEIFKA